MNKSNAKSRRFYCSIESNARQAERQAVRLERAAFWRRWSLLPPEVLEWTGSTFIPWLMELLESDPFLEPEEAVHQQPYEFLHAWDKWRELYPVEMAKFREALAAR